CIFRCTAVSSAATTRAPGARGSLEGDREERTVIVALIVACEIGFWVLLAAGLAFRYLLRMPRTGLALLLCEPVLEVVLLVATALDLKNGAEPNWTHGLAALYIGYTVGHGHRTVK